MALRNPRPMPVPVGQKGCDNAEIKELIKKFELMVYVSMGDLLAPLHVAILSLTVKRELYYRIFSSMYL